MSDAKHKGIGLENTELQPFDQSVNNYLLAIASATWAILSWFTIFASLRDLFPNRRS